MDAGFFSLIQYILKGLGVINYRLRIGHADNGGKTACCCRMRTGQDILFIRKSRIAEMHMHIHQARRNRHACPLL